VSSVRQAAGVSSADATRYLKEWWEEKAAAGTQIAATPHAVLEHAARLAGRVWAEVAKLTDDRHAGIEAQWPRERQEKTTNSPSSAPTSPGPLPKETPSPPISPPSSEPIVLDNFQ
jgi:hypothetical protein